MKRLHDQNSIKVSDYVVRTLIELGIEEVFGYPGGMVTHLIDSLSKFKDKISTHICSDERSAAFAACGYAQSSNKIGVAFSTSGPGATNLITGIANAYFDSIPTIFITGQVNTQELRGNLPIRQRGFQEMDVVSLVKSITKFAKIIKSPDEIPKTISKAVHECITGKCGPALLDIPMDIQRSYISDIKFDTSILEKRYDDCTLIKKYIDSSKRPCILLGNGVKQSHQEENIIKQLSHGNVPIISSMLAIDVSNNIENSYGFIGAYGSRAANFIASKCDLLISIGSRLDIRQVGINRDSFAPNATILRIDIDSYEFEYPIHKTDICLNTTIENLIESKILEEIEPKFEKWNQVCKTIHEKLKDLDKYAPVLLLKNYLNDTPAGTTIVTDVGQNQVWVAQALPKHKKHKLLFSGNFGSMGYALPAAIGAYYALKEPILCIIGDGGFQMCMSDLNYISKNNLPITTIVVNNNALGMIRHFQEMYFNSDYYCTKKNHGYHPINAVNIGKMMDITSETLRDDVKITINDGARLYELIIDEDTYVTPKLEFGKPNQDQTPYIDRTLYNELEQL